MCRLRLQIPWCVTWESRGRDAVDGLREGELHHDVPAEVGRWRTGFRVFRSRPECLNGNSGYDDVEVRLV